MKTNMKALRLFNVMVLRQKRFYRATNRVIFKTIVLKWLDKLKMLWNISLTKNHFNGKILFFHSFRAEGNFLLRRTKLCKFSNYNGNKPKLTETC